MVNRWIVEKLLSFHSAIPDFVDGKDTPRDYLERCLETVEAREHEVKAFVTLNLDSARAAADASTDRYRKGSPLSLVDGCPIGVKDIIETFDMPTQMNNDLYKGWRSNRDAACVHALREGGAIIVGKTVTTELAFGRSGPTRNPHDLERTPGGSSSGSAASVGAGMLPVALGTQTNGSTIRPASYNGIFALKTSLGALSMAGIHPLSVTLDHLAVLAGSLEDTWRVSHFISNAAGSPGHPGLMEGPKLPAEKKPRRFARLYTMGWEELDEETVAGFEDFVSGLKSDGVEVLSREENPKLSELEKYLDDYVEEVLDILAYEMRWPMSEYLRHHEDMMGPRIHEFVKRSSEISQESFRALLERRAEAQERVTKWRSEVDGFLTLSSSGPAIVDHEFTGSRTFLLYWSWLGFPSFNLPLLTSGGLPVGVQLMGFRDKDHRLAAFANWICARFFSH